MESQSDSHKEQNIVSEHITNTGSVELDPTRAAFAADEGVEALGRTHFIGIGGAGMSVLAEMLHERGVEVGGSDREEGTKTERLRSLGIDVRIGQRAGNVAGARTVVYSSAIKPDNPEIVAASQAGARIVHRSDILALLMHGRHAVTVAGAHGKTTTSSLLAHILVTAGTGELADPSYAIGGSIQTPDGGTRDGGHAGTGTVLVAEADESDGSFVKYRPDIAIVTNAEADHLDHYGTEADYRAVFVAHLAGARRAIVICVDEEGGLAVLRALDPRASAHVIAYGTHAREELGDLNGADYVRITAEGGADDGAERFSLCLPGREPLPVRLSIPGVHNARNAAAAIIAANLLGMPADVAADAAASFLGAARRFDTRGEVGGVTVIDDYAHHPTEIAALLAAARRRYPTATIHALFQPHLFSRTRIFADQFAQALSAADDVIVTGIFPARERQEGFPDVSASTIADAAPAGSHIEAVEDMHVAAQMMVMRAHPGDVILTVGAGDINQMDSVLLTALKAHAGTDAR